MTTTATQPTDQQVTTILTNQVQVHSTDFDSKGWLEMRVSAYTSVDLDDQLQPTGKAYVDEVTIHLANNAEETTEKITIPRDFLHALAQVITALDQDLPASRAPQFPDYTPGDEPPF